MFLELNARVVFCSTIKEEGGGLDFYFHTKSAAASFVEFLASVVPIKYVMIVLNVRGVGAVLICGMFVMCRLATSSRLVSEDRKSNVQNMKWTYVCAVFKRVGCLCCIYLILIYCDRRWILLRFVVMIW